MARSARKIADQIATNTAAGSKELLDVAIINAAGVHVDPSAAGIQYTEGDVDTTISGTPMMFEGSGDTLKVPSSTNPLPSLELKGGFQNATWTEKHLPAANTQATITRASAGGSIKNVCTGFTVTLCAGVTAPAAIQVSVAVIDGATGGGTYLWRSNISLPAIAGAITSFVRGGLWLVGTAATGLTIEFSAAAGANTFESVTMEGTTTL